MSIEDDVVGHLHAPAPPRTVEADDLLVLEVLSRLAGAGTLTDVALSAADPLADLPGVRASAVVVRDGSQALVVASAGYDCSSMAAGAALPLDAGLPVTEAVRTARTVVQGRGPSWVALPFALGRGRSGALLLSLHAAPPAELGRLQRITGALGAALRRAESQQQALGRLAAVTAQLVLPDPRLAGWDLAVRSRPYEGPVGGDVVLCLPDGRGGSWLVVADVCGSGPAAAVVGRSVHAAFTALAPQAPGAAALLAAADAALRSSVGEGSFVTAVVVHAEGSSLDVATAGHPAPLLLMRDRVRVLDTEPGVPLALESRDGSAPAGATFSLPADAVLLLCSDGLVDRRRADGPHAADPVSLAAGRRLDDLEQLADELLAAADRVGAAADDVTLLLARPSA